MLLVRSACNMSVRGARAISRLEIPTPTALPMIVGTAAVSLGAWPMHLAMVVSLLPHKIASATSSLEVKAHRLSRLQVAVQLVDGLPQLLLPTHERRHRDHTAQLDSFMAKP